MSPEDARIQALRDVVRGDKTWRDLNSLGISVDVSNENVQVFTTLERPVRVSAADVARGWLRHVDNDIELREWARFVHGAVGLIELAFEDHPLGESLLDGLWRISFGEPVPRNVTETARRILVSPVRRP